MAKTDGSATFDVIVVGSGMTSGLAAQELTRSGLKVLVLDRGRPIDADRHHKANDVKPWDLPFSGLAPRELYREKLLLLIAHTVVPFCY